jgi:UDP-N-acetylglucosamine diphosphorylase/glucosamine-1-phosphate N-acetyltransferase
VDVVKARYPHLSVNHLPMGESPVLLFNGRCADHAIIKQAAQLPVGHQLCTSDNKTVAAHIPTYPQGEMFSYDTLQTTIVDDTALLTRPWQIHTILHDNLVSDIDLCPFPMIGSIEKRFHGVVAFGDHAIKVHPSAHLQPGVILNSENGPIVIGPNAFVESPAVIQGPCSIGKGAMIAPMTQLRSDTVIGPVCKVGGEIKSTIIAGYSNKAHAGYLGNALVGYWVNLGADTTASNLKNTYSPVRMQLVPDDEREDTGLPNLGPIIGDYVRTGITTRMPTGTVIGTGTMIAQSKFTPTCVPRMRFITDEGDVPYDVEKFITTANAMMARRDCELTEAEAAYLHQLV